MTGKVSSFGGAAGGRAPLYIHPVKIVVGGWEYDIEVGFTNAAGIKDNPWGYGLVGQIGFFEFFTVRFKYRKGAIELAQNVGCRVARVCCQTPAP